MEGQIGKYKWKVLPEKEMLETYGVKYVIKDGTIFLSEDEVYDHMRKARIPSKMEAAFDLAREVLNTRRPEFRWRKTLYQALLERNLKE
jgi:hypothetical protein